MPLVIEDLMLFPDHPRFCRYVGKITDHHKNLGCIRKIEMVPICLRPSKMIRDVYMYDSVFFLVSKNWDGQET